MKRILLTALSVLFLHIAFGQYVADELGPSFLKRTIVFPNDYEGKVVCTLVKQISSPESKKAILYVHGYNDYFFQKEMAQKFTKAGYRFYALDLRKYGRSILPGQFPTHCRSVEEYFADIDTAISVIRTEGAKEIVLMGHSTGGLTTSLYAQSKGNKINISGLILNSPFFDMNDSWFNENVGIPMIASLGKLFKNTTIKGDASRGYGESLLAKYKGEWSFDTTKKVIDTREKRWSWIRAIHKAHLEVQKGLDIKCPVLLMSSDRSYVGTDWNPNFQTADCVLDVKDIQKYGSHISKQTTRCVIPGGMHDLVLSKKNVREAVYREMFSWLQQNKL